MHVVGSKGQVVITQPIREQLGVGPGWLTVQRIVGDHVELHFIPPPHRASLKGALSGHLERTVSEEEWERARDEAWASLAGRRTRDGDR